MASQRISPPSQLDTIMEARASLEMTQLIWALPRLRAGMPRGSGPVLVIPGFMNDDSLTWPLRGFLSSLGYEPSRWGQGVSRRGLMAHLQPLLQRTERLAAEGPISVVGYSRGGILAREIARERPDLVKGIVTVASPVRGGPQATSIGAYAARQTGVSIEEMRRIQQQRARIPIGVPIVALYSKTDGIVSWRACIDEHNPAQHIEVRGSHAGMMFNVAVYGEIAKALAAMA